MLELQKFFRPELINSFDEVIVFEPLRFTHMMSIVKLQFKGITKLLEDQDMGLTYTEAAVKEIVRSGFDPIYGARPLRRAIQKLIENPISSLIIEQKFQAGDVVMVDFNGDEFTFSIEKAQFVLSADKTLKKFICETCGNNFKTEVVKASTPICSKCASIKVKETIEEKEKKDDLSLNPQKLNGEKPPAQMNFATG